MGSVNEFQNRWELQGHESEQTFGLNRVNFGARVYNPTIGRWDRVDNFSEAAPNLSGYRYSFNNPVNVIDPDGNFEYSDGYGTYSSFGATGTVSFSGAYQGEIGDCPTCPKAKEYSQYHKSNNLFNFDSSTSIVYNGEGEASVTAEAPLSISEWDGEFNDPMVRWANSENLVSKFSYNMLNDAYLTLQGFDFDLLGNDHENPITGKRAFTNMDGKANYKPIEGLVNTLSFAIPTSKAPVGLGYIKHLNAAGFSTMFKGSFVTKLSPQYRGMLNRGYNQGVNWVNSQISGGKSVFKMKSAIPVIHDTSN